MEDDLKSLEITEDSFWELRLQGAVYVDKTSSILELVKSRGPFFLARPRRFGKSLLVDTIRQIFEGRKELFTGLAIETLSPDFTWETFPVIRINMNNVSSDPEQFQTDLISKLLPVAKSYKVKISRSSVAGAISDLIINMSIKYANQKEKKREAQRVDIGGKNVVLLIDEYDFPLLKHLHDPIKIDKIRSMLYDFYSSIKGCSDFLRFVFITGITKFKQLSLFSALNNVKDITFDKNFSTICGFTSEEITTSYSKYLDRAISARINEGFLPPGSTVKDIMAEISEWYDGYSWDGRKRVFNPFSIKSFLENHEFDDFWYDSGVPLFSNVIESFDGERFAIFGKNISIDGPLKIQDTANINGEAILFQAGYLTIDSIEKTNISRKYHLKIPNKEIRDAIDKELSVKFQEFVKKLKFMNNSIDPLKTFSSMKDRLLSSLWSCNADESEELLGSIFSGNPKEWYRNGGEGSYKLILMAIMRFGGAVYSGNMLEAMGEVYSDAGRADLVFDVSGKGYIVMELKYAAVGNRVDTGGDAVPDKKSNRSIQFRPDYTEIGESRADLSGYSRLIEQGNVTDNVRRILENKIAEAFVQISDKDYAKPYLVAGKPVLATAIAVYDTSTVMVRFAKVIWKSGDDREVDIMEIHPSDQQDPLFRP
ncbi:MAG: AAA family ATPase [Deltaproteobacteria bacterium]|jgi:hypothetical protein|nr:AAA family ATPase [Deltaproteobacteria bacterium]